jgi:hypothetical protein
LNNAPVDLFFPQIVLVKFGFQVPFGKCCRKNFFKKRPLGLLKLLVKSVLWAFAAFVSIAVSLWALKSVLIIRRKALLTIIFHGF